MSWTIKLINPATDLEIPMNEIDLPVVEVTIDSQSLGGLLLPELRIAVVDKPHRNSTVEVRAAVLRRSAMVPNRAPRDAVRGEIINDSPLTLGVSRLENLVAGVDNELILWLRERVPGGSGGSLQPPIVFRYPIEARFYNPNSISLKTRLLYSALNHDIHSTSLPNVPQEMGGTVENATGNSCLQFGRIPVAPGIPVIDDPRESEPPQDVALTPMFMMPLYRVPNVAGHYSGGNLETIVMTVLRAASEIPATPTGLSIEPVSGIPYPADASNGKFVAAGVGGAVKGLDNKLVVWAKFQGETIPVRVVRRFNGV